MLFSTMTQISDTILMSSKNHLSMQLIDIVTTYTYVLTRLQYSFGVLKEYKYLIPRHKLATYIVYWLVNDYLRQPVECGTIHLLVNPSCWRDTQRIVCLCAYIVAHSKHTIIIDIFQEMEDMNWKYWTRLVPFKIILSQESWIQMCLYPKCIEKVQYKRIISIPPMVAWFSHIPWDVLISCKSIRPDIVFEMIC
jgi:hypothetical protein